MHQIDIHGGGEDLTFPHHENEIAQSEAAGAICKVLDAQCFINIDNKKMSKSEGNFYGQDITKEYSGQIIPFHAECTLPQPVTSAGFNWAARTRSHVS